MYRIYNYEFIDYFLFPRSFQVFLHNKVPLSMYVFRGVLVLSYTVVKILIILTFKIYFLGKLCNEIILEIGGEI